MKKNILFFLAFLAFSSCVKAQLENSCTYMDARMDFIESRMAKLDKEDPELISLHYRFLQDYIHELQLLEEKHKDHLFYCENKDSLLMRCVCLRQKANQMEKVFAYQAGIVDQLFYSKAKVEFIFADYDKADYYLDRALQFNKHNVEALLMKAELKFRLHEYEECLPYIKELFNENTLTEEQENEVYRFSSKFYHEVYNAGDSLVKIDKGAYAIDMFQLLETFCHDMPTSYCNDDYYHGIMRSKQGIYESYIAIAKAARQRKNYDIEQKFLKYAEEYKKTMEENEWQ